MFVPITFRIGSPDTPIKGSAAVFEESASAEILIPGAIIPPIKAPVLSTAKILVAVPRSIMITGSG